MRVILVASLLGLAACDGEAMEGMIRNEYRDDAVESCLPHVAAAARDVDSLNRRFACECAVDDYMEGKTTGELMQGPTHFSAAFRPAIDRCLVPHRNTGPADSSVRAHYRFNGIFACTRSVAEAPPDLEVALRSTCACAVDRYMEGKAEADLPHLHRGNVQDRLAAELDQCLGRSEGPAAADQATPRP